MDQLQVAPVHECYLPYASSPGLLGILEALQAEPGDNRPLADWATQIHVSERTLARQFVRELGMSFGEWRQRLRFLAAIEALDSHRSIQDSRLRHGVQHGLGLYRDVSTPGRMHTGAVPTPSPGEQEGVTGVVYTPERGRAHRYGNKEKTP